MKNILVRFNFVLILVQYFQIVKAQTTDFHYDYDDSGNRIHRIVLPTPRLADSAAQNIFNEQTQQLADDFKPKEQYSEKIAGHEIKIYPNPTRGQLVVQMYGYNTTKTSKIEVYDEAGKLIFTKSPLNEFNNLDISDKKAGSYVLRIFIDKDHREWKVFKAE